MAFSDVSRRARRRRRSIARQDGCALSQSNAGVADVFSDPGPGWIVLFIALVGVSAASGEGVPLAGAFVVTVVLFGLWRLSLWGFDELRR